MAEDFALVEGTKEEQYKALLPHVEALLSGEYDLIANLANVAAVLKQQFEWLWVGFYLIKDECLVLGPFQGPIACTRIKKGKGVCGASWEQQTVMVVPDVEKFPGHIACSSLSKSEIVVPLFDDTEIRGVLDVDSIYLDSFAAIDAHYLKQVVTLLKF